MSDKEKRSAIKAAFWYTLSNFISKTILYLCTPLFTRILTKAEFGQYYNFLSWQNILLAIFAMDLGASITVAYFDYNEENDFRSFISTISIASIIIPLLLSCGVFFFKDFFTQFFNFEWQYLLVMLANLTFGNTLQIFQIEQRTRVEYRLSSILTLLAAIGTVLLTFVLLLLMNNKLKAILIGNVAFNIIVSVVLLLFLLKRKCSFKWKHLKFALILSVPLIPHILSGAITGSSGQILITKFCGAEKTALFGLAFTISMVITMFSASINKAWVPWFFAKLKCGEISSIKSAIRRILSVLTIGTIGFCLVAPEIILIIGGKNYFEAVYLMPPIILQCFFNYVYTLYVNVEFYEKKTFLIPIATVCTAVINLFLNYILLQSLDYYIVAYISLFSAVLLLLLHFLIVKWMKKIFIFENSYILKMLSITSFVCFTIMLTYQHSIARFISIVFYSFVIIFLFTKKKDLIKQYCKEFLG